MVDFLVFELSLVLSVASDSLFGDFSVLASVLVFFDVLLVESALLFLSVLVVVLVDASAAGLLVEAGLLVVAGLVVVVVAGALAEGFVVEVGG